MKHLTIRNVPDELHEALHEEKERSGKSLNQTVIDLLRQRLGIGSRPSSGLSRFGGGWSNTDVDEFHATISPLESIDDGMWR